MVKQGYKQTEVGIIPEDWKVSTMESITSLMTNGFVGTIKSEYVPSGTGILYLQGFNIKENGFDLTGVTYVSDSFNKKHLKSELKENDLLTVQTGDIGVTSYLPKQFEGANCQALIISRFYDKYDSRFWSYYFNSIGRKTLKLIETGTTMKHINVGDMKGVLVPVPTTKEEQKRIAEALSDADSMVSSLEKLIAKKKVVKQGAMQELLTGKKRLPGFDGEWTVKYIDDIATIMDNCRIPVKESDREKMAGTIPYCGANGIVGYINGYTIDDEIILIAEDGGYFDEYATRPIAYKMSGKCWVNNHAHILKSKSNTDQNYLFYCLVHKDIRDFISSGTRSKLNKAELLKITIKLPLCLEEQIAIASILSDMDKEIESLEQKLSKTRQIKQGMMQQLLTGRIRLV